MNIFGKKNEFEQKIDTFKQLFNTEYDMADTFVETIREWARLEADYSRELLAIKAKIDRIPRKMQ